MHGLILPLNGPRGNDPRHCFSVTRFPARFLWDVCVTHTSYNYKADDYELLGALNTALDTHFECVEGTACY